jgi:hypothetical protein
MKKSKTRNHRVLDQDLNDGAEHVGGSDAADDIPALVTGKER